MKGIQRSLERVDSLSLLLLEQTLQHEYNHILFQEELFWFQKSREQWVKLGDKNTAYFHAQTVIRRKRNKIHGLNLPNGIWCCDEEILQQEAQSYFQSLFCANQNVQVADFSLSNIPVISEEEKTNLAKPVSKEEVMHALSTMQPFKAPGPNGFQAVFFKHYWDIVGDDLWNLVRDAFSSGRIDPALTDTLIALIPKVDSPKSFKDFRPISLCNTIYKILTKVLVQRIRPILCSLIGPFQSSFLPGRGTTDNAIVLQEIVHAMKKSKKKNGEVAYKIDLEKAYDHVDWTFLSQTLLDFGFPQVTVNLIMQCVTTSTLSVLWNGKRLPSFSPTRGLRQGDPLSPYLFVLCMEKLSLAIQAEVENGNWLPFKFPKNGPPISHLLFADDVLLFTKARSSQARLVSNILDNFGKVSGLKVNVNKSRSFFSSGVPTAKARKSTQLTQIREAKSLEKYPGFPLPHGRQTKKDFEFITGKMTARLASWKHKLLNRAGRVALASSVLTAIPSYYMQISWLPQSVCNQIDKISRDFIWKGAQNKGVNLVNWQKVSLPKSHGGLGIRTAREANTSLLGKLVWDVQQDRDKLWVQLLRNRYNVKGSFLTSGNKAGSPTWSAITKANDILKGGYEFRIGAGNISFWFDHWTDIGPLHNLLPYIDIHDLDLKLKDVYDGNEWKLDNLYTLLPDHLKNFISGNYIYINQDVQDLHIWGASTNGSYSTKSGFSWLLQQRDNAPIEQAWKWIWKLPTQQNVRLFFWLAFHNSIPTLSVLHHRGISTTADCKSCQGAEETLLHCLRDCPMAKRLWQSLGFTKAMFFQQQDTHCWLKQGATGPNDTLFIAAV